MKTTGSSTSSMASGSRSKSEAPKMDPAEKATRKKRMEWSVLSLNDSEKMPVSENTLTINVAITMVNCWETMFN